MPQSPTRYLDTRTRVKHGRERERQIAIALQQQHRLPIEESGHDDDCTRKIDRWVDYPTGRVALQIKYRETGADLLFEVFDKFFGWDDPRNKVGRDMIGQASEYAVLLEDRKTVVMVPVELAKSAIQEMLDYAQTHGMTCGNSFKHFVSNHKLELKIQNDPSDGRQKMVAYMAAGYFISKAQAKVYEVLLPKTWK